MNNETRQCQNCKQNFTIEPEDFNFYEKIKVPPPTFCPECRMVRKMYWRNEKTLYKRKDDRTGKIIFSQFSDIATVKVWERDDWFSDILDSISYGRDYNFNQPLFEQLYLLVHEVPLPSRSIILSVNSPYCMNDTNIRNCYLTFASSSSENCSYCVNLDTCKDCFDINFGWNLELCYDSFFNRNCYKAFFSSFCEDSHDITLCKDCFGVSFCFGCVNLRNKSYYIFNQPYSKDEYFKKIKELELGSYYNLEKIKNKVLGDLWLKYPCKYFHGRRNINSDGEYIWNSKNVKNSYGITGGENLRYCQHLSYSPGSKDSYDHFRFGMGSELIYESLMCGDNISALKFCYLCTVECSDLTYCMFCLSSKNLFACIGLRNKQYCILNKQYTKEEYEELVPKIIKHMNDMPYIDKKGKIYKYGEFFPAELSPFAYNETIAQEYFPLTKEEALEKGYQWKDREDRNYQADLKTEDLPDNIKDVNEDIINKVIECEHKGARNEQCTEAFKISPDELQFYKRMNLPLPRLCPNCRHYQRLKQRNPLKLWHRVCMCNKENHHNHNAGKCEIEFETSYAPDRPEIVYCEKCYQQEVY